MTGATPDMQDAAQRVRAAQRAIVDTLERQQEILHDISFAAGAYWQRLDDDVVDQIMDAIDGSRGLKDKCVEWAREFDALWEASANKDNYIGVVDDFAIQKINAMVAEIRLS